MGTGRYGRNNIISLAENRLRSTIIHDKRRSCDNNFTTQIEGAGHTKSFIVAAARNATDFEPVGDKDRLTDRSTGRPSHTPVSGTTINDSLIDLLADGGTFRRASVIDKHSKYLQS